jgi:hypothetical protein
MIEPGEIGLNGPSRPLNNSHGPLSPRDTSVSTTEYLPIPSAHGRGAGLNSAQILERWRLTSRDVPEDNNRPVEVYSSVTELRRSVFDRVHLDPGLRSGDRPMPWASSLVQFEKARESVPSLALVSELRSRVRCRKWTRAPKRQPSLTHCPSAEGHSVSYGSQNIPVDEIVQRETASDTYTIETPSKSMANARLPALLIRRCWPDKAPNRGSSRRSNFS